MKLAILADVHGNVLALKAVLDAAKKENVCELLIAGDLVGYYFHTKEVLKLLESWDKNIVRGNHEDELEKAIKSQDALEKYDETYGHGLRTALETLNSNELEYLISLPFVVEVDKGSYRILLCHGSPWDTNQYIYPDSPDALYERCIKKNISVIITGHTHYPHIRSFQDTLFINPGSVGQPRNRIPGADWALFDTDTGEVELRHENYDVGSVVKEAKKINPEKPYLSEVLTRK